MASIDINDNFEEDENDNNDLNDENNNDNNALDDENDNIFPDDFEEANRLTKEEFEEQYIDYMNKNNGTLTEKLKPFIEVKYKQAWLPVNGDGKNVIDIKEDTVLYVVGDCHGDLNQFLYPMIDFFNEEKADKYLIYLGNYIDQGEFSVYIYCFIRAVENIFLKNKDLPQSRRIIFLRGNHEQCESTSDIFINNNDHMTSFIYEIMKNHQFPLYYTAYVKEIDKFNNEKAIKSDVKAILLFSHNWFYNDSDFVYDDNQDLCLVIFPCEHFNEVDAESMFSERLKNDNNNANDPNADNNADDANDDIPVITIYSHDHKSIESTQNDFKRFGMMKGANRLCDGICINNDASYGIRLMDIIKSKTDNKAGNIWYNGQTFGINDHTFAVRTSYCSYIRISITKDNEQNRHLTTDMKNYDFMYNSNLINFNNLSSLSAICNHLGTLTTHQPVIWDSIIKGAKGVFINDVVKYYQSLLEHDYIYTKLVKNSNNRKPSYKSYIFNHFELAQLISTKAINVNNIKYNKYTGYDVPLDLIVMSDKFDLTNLESLYKQLLESNKGVSAFRRIEGNTYEQIEHISENLNIDIIQATSGNVKLSNDGNLVINSFTQLITDNISRVDCNNELNGYFRSMMTPIVIFLSFIGENSKNKPESIFDVGNKPKKPSGYNINEAQDSFEMYLNKFTKATGEGEPNRCGLYKKRIDSQTNGMIPIPKQIDQSQLAYPPQPDEIKPIPIPQSGGVVNNLFKDMFWKVLLFTFLVVIIIIVVKTNTDRLNLFQIKGIRNNDGMYGYNNSGQYI